MERTSAPTRSFSFSRMPIPQEQEVVVQDDRVAERDRAPVIVRPSERAD